MARDRLADIREVQLEENTDANHAIVGFEMAEVALEEEEFMGEFFKQIEIIEQDLSGIENDIDYVDDLQNDILTASKVDYDDKARLENAMTSIKLKTNRSRARLKDIEASIREASDTSAEIRIKRTQHAALSHRLVNAMLKFNLIQNEYRDRCKEKLKRQLSIAGKPATDEEVEDMLENWDLEIFTQSVDPGTKDARLALEGIKTRHDDILLLEKSVKDLQDMFLDVAMLVENQAEMLDSIEHQAGNAVDYVDRATADVKKALEYQSAARKKKIICIVLVLILLAIIGIIILSQLNLGGTSTATNNVVTTAATL
ncbi:syntaxin 1.3 [Trichoplax adhaerens]|uniref:Syntaxin 1.3 n=1 Tax=Trichoplax adhaerens TaxID=10228 RepID=B3S4L4_TRIAD|nr:syntaxin 1.3 [Trichoplax adhaerens]EDV22651.1 syntaxin 1.3 [Trichoplax adhaerens]|eukprot:XP_002115195.1 syntaxin 1.3 [Trichoplax adhaerens]